MSKKVLVVGSGIALLIAAGVYKNHSLPNRPANYGTVMAASAWAPPDCPHGFEPGGGAMRCADPNDPNSWKNKQKAERAKPADKGYTVSADGKEIITPDGKHWWRRPDWIPSPQQDPTFCKRVASRMHSARALNRCVQIQSQEYSPSQADYAAALGQIHDALWELNRISCINEHGTWDQRSGNCTGRR